MIPLSIVIPTYNRSRMVLACLDSLAHQTDAAESFEVIVVVDGSTDDTEVRLSSLHTRFPLRVLVQENAGPAAARNTGIQAAGGEYCLFLDDDMAADPGLVIGHLRVQRERANTVTLGHIDTRLPPDASRFAQYLQESWARHHAELAAGIRPATFMDSWTGNLCAPRSALEAVGGFAADLPANEDIEIGYRLSKRGLSFTYVADAVGHQHFTKSFAEIVRDCEVNGVGAVELHRRYPSILAHLQLGGFNQRGFWSTLARRAALRTPLSAWWVTWLSKLADHLPHRAQAYWYASLYDYLYWRGVGSVIRDRDDWRRLTGGAAILMYHAVGNPGERESRYVMSARRFGRQMAWLRRRGYNVVSLEEYVRCRQEHALPPSPCVILTIDDGYEDVRTRTRPILDRYELPATLFVVSRGAAATRWQRRDARGDRPLLSLQDLREMTSTRVKCGSHGRSHVGLTGLSESEIWEEVHGSRAELENAIGGPVRLFAYPYGECDERSEAAVARAGYSAACGIAYGLNDPATPLFRLRRTEIRGQDSLLRFFLALWTGRTWLVRRK